MDSPNSPPPPRSAGTPAGAFLEDGVPNWLLKAGLSANVLLGLVLGLTFAILAMVILGPVKAADRSKIVVEFASLYAPERDIPLYVLGCGVAALLAAGLAFVWRLRLRKQEVALRNRWAISTVEYVLLFSLAVLAAFPQYYSLGRWIFSTHPNPSVWKGLAVLAAPPCLLLVLVLFVFFAPPMAPWLRSGKFSVWDCVTPIAVFAALYVPDCARLAGNIFQVERFHHLDFYVMAPTLAFSHGKALGTEFFSQYGVGWPVFFTALRPLLSISYGHILNVFVLYGCLYFCGIYLLLRLLTRSGAWAAFGTAACVFFQVFNGVSPDAHTIWRYPSSSVIRSAMDVWCFLCLYRFANSGRWRWAAGAAAASALGVVFELDTGIYLAVALGATLLACFWLRDATGSRTTGPARRFAGNSLKVTAVWLAVIVAILAVASRGTLLSPAFWRGWLEAVLFFGSGFSSMPLASNSIENLQGFLLIVLVLCGMVGWCAIEFATSGPRARTLIFGGIALYGLADQLLFVNRSHPLNLYHSIVPCCLAGVGLVFTAYEHLRERLHGALGALPVFLLIGLLPAFFLQPQMRSYPNAINWAIHRNEPQTPAVASPIPGVKVALPPGDAGMAGLRTVVEWMRSHAESGAQVAILDSAETHYYAASGTSPWYRYSPLFDDLSLQTQVQEAGRYLVAHPPAFALIRTAGSAPLSTWNFFHALLVENFTRAGSVGDFEVWSPKQ